MEMQTIFFERWGMRVMPGDMTRDQQAKMLAISIGLGSIFNENPVSERHWMNTPRDGITPMAMIFAGKYDDVLNLVNDERFPPNCT